METSGNRTFKLVLEYDGTGFAGWQKQPGKRTVQGEVEKVLGGLTGERVRVTAAGRTDAGVHALGQVASFTASWRHGAGKLAAGLNGILPPDIAVKSAEEAPPGFSARWDALSRSYRYAFLLRPVRSPLLERTAWRVSPSLDTTAMSGACALFRGRHDFSAFTTRTAAAGGAVRRVIRCVLSRHGESLFLDVTGEAFLHHMVRFMAGALAGVGQGRIKAPELGKALGGKGSPRIVPAPAARVPPASPAQWGPAPAHGLTLMGVRYAPKGRSRGGAITRPPVSY